MSVVIAGVSVPDQKKIPYALRYIKGIGTHTAFQICKALNFDTEKRLKEISQSDLVRIRDELEKYMIENDLMAYRSNCRKTKIQLRTYQGLRHEKNLPVRGQRTHSNAETRRSGKAK